MAQQTEPIATPRTPPRRAVSSEERPSLTPADILLNRVVVVEHERAAELVAGLAASGIAARTVPAAALATLIAGLVVAEDGPELPTVGEALRALRQRGAAAAAIVLGDPTPERLAARLADGADALLPADAPADAVAAQLRVLARLIATEPPAGEPEVITVRGITVDLERREVRAGGRVLSLTPTEFRLLALLARKRGVVSHAELFREVHGYGVSEQEAKDMIKVHIWRLRAKLAEAVPESNPIVNVRGFGYLLERRAGRDRRQRAEDRPA